MKTSTKSTVKNLTNTTALKATKIASVELFEKTLIKVKAPVKAKQAHIFATDGVTRITAADKTMLEGLRGDVGNSSIAALALGKQAVTMKARALSLWSIFGGENVTSASLFAKLITDGYLDKATVSGATSPSGIKNAEKRALAQLARDTNQALFATNKHPLFQALDDNSPTALANRAKAKVIASNAPKATASTSTANLTDSTDAVPAVATDTHVTAMCQTFMRAKPSDLARVALLKSVAQLLGFELEGFHNAK
jgi:hypothetical protein